MRFGLPWSKWSKPKDRAEIQYLGEVAMSPSLSIRVNLARELGTYIADNNVARVKKESLAPIFEILMSDTSEDVQVALAKATCQSKYVLPRGVIFKIAAEGCQKASAIMFKQSPLISKKLMIHLIQKGEYFHQLCIAGRIGIPLEITSLLIAVGDENVIEKMLSNDSALIDEAGYRHLLTRFANNTLIDELIGARSGLPPVITEILVTTATERMREVAVSKGWLQEHAAEDMAIDLREKYTLEIAEKHSDEDAMKLIVSLHAADRLSSTLILRAACAENMRFAEYGLAQVSRLPISRVVELLYSGPMGVGAVAARAGFDSTLTLALIHALEVHNELQAVTGTEIKTDIGFSRRMIEHVLAQGADIAQEEQRALLSLLKRFSDGDDKALAEEVIEAMDKAA